MTDIILESVRAFVLFGLVLFLVHIGRTRFSTISRGWNWVVGGFCLLLFGSLLDITDNFETLNRFVVIGDTEVEAFLEKFVGFLGGFVVLAVGLVRWIPEELAKRTQAEETHGRLTQAVENVPVGIVLFDSDDRVVFFNSRYAELMEVMTDILKPGVTFEEMIRTMVERQPVKDARGREEEFIQERIKHHRNPTGPFDIRREDKWLSADETRLNDGSIFTIIIDITEQKAAEEALRESEERFRILFEHAPEAITILDVDTGLYVDANPMAETLHGLPREELIGKIGPENLSPEIQLDGRPSSEAASDYLSRALAGQFPRFDWMHLTPDGQETLCEVGLTHLPDPHRNLVRACIIDITERKQAEDRLQSFIDNVPSLVSIKDLEGNYLLMNNQYTKQFDFNSQNKGAEAAKNIFSEEVLEKFALHEAKVIGAKSPVTQEHEISHPDGNHTHLCTKFPILDSSGGVIAIGSVSTDISERKRMEEALLESEEKHRHFSADVAHELRTPLAVLRSHLDNLENTETIQSLINDVDTMSRLVSQLLATTRLDSLTVNPDDEADLHAIGIEVAKYLGPFAIKEGRSIEMTGTQDPVIVQGNDDALEMAVRNLVENAIRYSARESVITIHVSDNPAISVIDHGRGITPEQQKVIFERFKRADQRSGGAGLGLSIVRRVVEAHQATINVSDTPGGGTVFKISFPTQ
jgi:PAS domain S-box-containing protein